MTLSTTTRQQARFRKLVDNQRRWGNASRFCDMFGSHWLKISSGTTPMIDESLSRLRRVEEAIGAQRVYVLRAEDPDTRYRAEGNLIKLILARNDLRECILTLRSRNAAARH